MATTYVDQISGSGSSPVPVDPVTGAGETVAYKAPCRLATTGNITLSGLQTVDGQTTAANDRVLVLAQTDETQNGIWIAQAGSWFRARDFDSNRDITKGTRVTVIEGSTLGGKEYQITTSNPIALGTDDITFTETLSSDAGSSAAAAEAARDAAVVAKDAAVSAAGTASSAASAASTSAGNAATSESNASGSAATATAAAGTATSAAGAASTSAGNAATSETNAGNAASAAVAAKDAAEAAAGSVDTAFLLSRSNHTGSQAISTVTDLQTALDDKAPLNSPAFTGNPTAPTQTAGNNSTRIATTAFVKAAVDVVLGGVSSAFDTLAEIAAELGNKVSTSRQVATQHSLTGGGDLSANRTLALVNDTASPGNNMVYGTDPSGVRGWKADPAGAGLTYLGSVALSGTSHPLTGIPAGTKRVVVFLSAAKTGSNAGKSLQIGDSGGLETSGYTGASSAGGSAGRVWSSSVRYDQNESATLVRYGYIEFTRVDPSAHKWMISGILMRSDNWVEYQAGEKTLSADLDRVAAIADSAYSQGTMYVWYE